MSSYNMNVHTEKYDKKYQEAMIDFLRQCLPESGRVLDINGRHQFYRNIENCLEAFWCLFDGDEVIGTVGVKKLDEKSCELKSLYLYERYHGKGYGRNLITKALEFAKESGYEEMYLDSLSTSKKALALYRKVGFLETERYNQNERSDVFMVKIL